MSRWRCYSFVPCDSSADGVTFAIFFCALLFCMEKFSAIRQWQCSGGLLPLGLLDSPPTAYHAAAAAHSYFYPLRWHWYEWLGVIGPVLIFIWFYRIGGLRGMRISRGDIANVCCLRVDFRHGRLRGFRSCSHRRLGTLAANAKPLSFVHRVYFIFWRAARRVCVKGSIVEMVGDLLIRYGKECFDAQEALFLASPHLEWPGLKRERNPWAQAFAWARSNTPSDAIFAFAPSLHSHSRRKYE